MPALRHKRVLVWYAAFSDHCSLFPTAATVEMFKKELKGYSTSKGTIQFSLDKPPPIGLIKKIVKARVAQNEGKRANDHWRVVDLRLAGAHEVGFFLDVQDEGSWL